MKNPHRPRCSRCSLGARSPLAGAARADVELLNVSYDPTRELYAEFNPPSPSTGRRADGREGHDQAVARRLGQAGARGDRRARGRRRDARARLRHRRALRARQADPADWQTRLPNNSAPYTSTIVFLVRKGNPKGIKDWDDLREARRLGDHAEPEDLGRRALELPRGVGLRAAAARAADEAKAQRASSATLYKNVPVLDSGARGSTTTFVERGIGDVLHRLGERGAPRGRSSSGTDKFEIVVPSLSILAEPPVAVVDKVVDEARHARRSRRRTSSSSTRPRARSSPRKHYYRPRHARGRREVRDAVPEDRAVHDRRGFGGWDTAQTDALRRRRRSSTRSTRPGS